MPSLLVVPPSCRTLRPYVRCTACTTPRRRGRHRGPLPGALPSPTPDTSRRCPCAMRPECAGSVPATLSHIRGQKSILSAEAYTPHTSTPTECEPHTPGTYASPCTTFPLCAYHHPCPTPTHHTGRHHHTTHGTHTAHARLPAARPTLHPNHPARRKGAISRVAGAGFIQTSLASPPMVVLP